MAIQLRDELEESRASYEHPLNKIIDLAKTQNGWFEPTFVRHALEYWAKALSKNSTSSWISGYEIPSETSAKTVAIIMAGNIPLVGLHDLISVLISGNKAMVKPSSQDTILMSYVIELLRKNGFEYAIDLRSSEKLNDFDAVIATGSGNSARHFHDYFGSYPNMIRRNRTGVAVLDEQTSNEEIEQLMDDVFLYFGLGCRNVTKLYLPEAFDVQRIFKASLKYNYLIENQKYLNNYQYQKTLLSMQDAEILENGLFILKKDQGIFTPVSVLNYEHYSDTESLNQAIDSQLDDIQCVVGNKNIEFGKAQKPRLTDYADGVDTLTFLLSLNL